MRKSKKTSKIDIPTLEMEDAVELGKELPDTEKLPPVLNEVQLKALKQQIESIIETQLQTVLKKANQEVMKEVKKYLDKSLPGLVKDTCERIAKENQ